MIKIEPGWYKDPAAPKTQRYWDGEQWIGKPVSIDSVPPEKPEPEPLPEPDPEPEPKPETTKAASGSARRSAVAAGKPSAAAVAKLMAGRQLAHPGLRLAARLIDIMAVALLNMVVNGWFVYQYFVEAMPAIRAAMADPSVSPTQVELPDRATQLFVTILLISLLLWFAYEVPSTVNSGQTLGKRIVGIKVAPIYDDKRRYSAVISRWSLMILPVACFPFAVPLALIDGFWCLFDRPFQQCLHDKFAATMVVTDVADDSSSTTAKGDVHVPSDPT